MRGLSCILCVLFCLIAGPSLALAQTSTFQNRLVGQRAVGMGGAFTGLANDPSAAYYNAAALTNLSSNQLEVGLPILAFDYVRIYGGLVPNVAIREVNSFGLLALPTMLGVAAGLGSRDEEGRQPFVFGGSVLIPHLRQLSFRQTSGTNETSAFHLLQDNEQSTMIGGSVAARVDKWAFGLSLYYIHQNVSWLNTRAGTLSTCTEGVCVADRAYTTNTAVEGWAGSISPRLGILYQPNKKWSFGLNIVFSSFKMFGSASLRSGSSFASAAGIIQPPFVQTGKVGFDRPSPWEFRFGIAHKPKPRLQLAMDVTFFLPENFKMLSGIPEAESVYPVNVRRRFTMNVNLGVEFMIKRALPLRFGMFTNLSAAPRVRLDASGQSLVSETRRCSDVACQEYMNTGGLTVSLGVTVWKFALDFGVYGSYGRGYIQQQNPVGPTRFRWAEMDQLQLNFFIGGNLGKVIDETANELKDSIERRGYLPKT